MRVTVAAAVVAAGLAAGVGPVSTATAGHPAARGAGELVAHDSRQSLATPRHGVIAWSQYVDLNFSAARIVASGPYGRVVRVLSHPAQGIYDVNPEISPDGRWVVFQRERPNTSRIVIVGLHGLRRRTLDFHCVDPCLGDSQPTWAADSQHLYFQRALGPVGPDGNAASAAIWRADLHGARVVRVSSEGIDGRFEDQEAKVAPDGYLVVARVSLKRDRPALFRMRPDGTHARRLTPWRISADIFDVSPAAHGPTRNLVAFETYGHNEPPDGTSSAVAAVSAARDSNHRIRYLTSPTSVPVWNFNPTWSPDGRQVAYVRFKPSTKSDPITHGDIYAMRWDGTQRARVSRAKLFDYRPTWGLMPS